MYYALFFFYKNLQIRSMLIQGIYISKTGNFLRGTIYKKKAENIIKFERNCY